MRKLAISLLLAALTFTLGYGSTYAADCQFILGFKTLRDLIGHEVVGECLDNEFWNEIGDSNQRTTGGLMAWRKADNWTAFTDGYRTWINGPNGLAVRLNTERYYWEADYPFSNPVKVESVCFGAEDVWYLERVGLYLPLFLEAAGRYFEIFGERKIRETWKSEHWVQGLINQEGTVRAWVVNLEVATPKSEQAREFHAPLEAMAKHLLTFMQLWNRTLTEGVWDREELTESDKTLLNRLDYHFEMYKVFRDAVPEVESACKSG